MKPTKNYFLHDDNNNSGNTDMFHHQKVFDACGLCLHLQNLVSWTFNAVVDVGRARSKYWVHYSFKCRDFQVFFIGEIANCQWAELIPLLILVRKEKTRRGAKVTFCTLMFEF